MVVAATAAAALLAGIVIALTGAFPLLTLRPGTLPQHSAHGGTGSRTSRVTRRTLVVAQMACAFVLLVGAGLLWIRSEESPRPRHRNAHRRSDHRRHEPAWSALHDTGRRPRVRDAFARHHPPAAGRDCRRNHERRPTQRQLPEWHHRRRRLHTRTGRARGERYPCRGHARLLRNGRHAAHRGRYFDDRDNDPASRSLIIDEALARRFWPNGDAVGRRMFRPENPRQITAVDNNTRWLSVVGVVRFAKLRGPAAEEVTTGAFYLPYAVTAPREFGYVVRSHADSTVIINELRSALASIDREAPLFDIRTLDERTSLSLMSRTSTMRIASLFATVALFLSLVGLYGTSRLRRVAAQTRIRCTSGRRRYAAAYPRTGPARGTCAGARRRDRRRRRHVRHATGTGVSAFRNRAGRPARTTRHHRQPHRHSDGGVTAARTRCHPRGRHEDAQD